MSRKDQDQKQRHYLSLRKIEDMNKELYTIELSDYESNKMEISQISLSHYVNSEGQDVILYKNTNHIADFKVEYPKVLINRNNEWSKIEMDFDDQKKIYDPLFDRNIKELELKSKINIQDEILDGRFVDVYDAISLHTVEKT